MQVHALNLNFVRAKLERVMGIEPTFSAWEADVLPLNYTRFFHFLCGYFIVFLNLILPANAEVVTSWAVRRVRCPFSGARGQTEIHKNRLLVRCDPCQASTPPEEP